MSKANTLLKRLGKIYTSNNSSLKPNRREVLDYLKKNKIIKYRIHKRNNMVEILTQDNCTKAEIYSHLELYRK